MLHTQHLTLTPTNIYILNRDENYLQKSSGHIK